MFDGLLEGKAIPLCTSMIGTVNTLHSRRKGPAHELREWCEVSLQRNLDRLGQLPRATALLNPNITVVRRLNVLALFRQFAEQRLVAGEPPKGLEQEFAKKIEISPTQWSLMKTSRPIGNRLARQVEHHCGVPAGWLDEECEPQGITSAEQHVMSLALQAYRRTNATGRKDLIRLLKTHG